MKNYDAASGEIQSPAPGASEERYRSLLNSIDVGFCVVELLFDDHGSPVDFRFLETNPAFEKQSGLSDAVGKCVRTLVPQLEAHWFETYGRVALTGESIRFAHEAQALDGRWFDVYAFRLGAPELRHVAILFTDISVRRRLEEKTQEQADSLAELNRRKDEFLAMLSHELRNPLAAIRNAAHLIQMERTPGPMQLEAQGMLDRQIAQLTRLVDDLLDVSRISTGLVRLQLESVDLCGIVGRAVEICRPQVERKEQTLTVKGCPATFFANPSARGYYITAYDPALLKRIASSASVALNAAERAVLVDDAWTLVRRGRYQIGDFLDIVDQAKERLASGEWDVPSFRLQYIGDNLVDETTTERFAQRIRQLLRPAFDRLGWDAGANESMERRAASTQ